MELMINSTKGLVFIPGQIPSLKNTKIMGKFLPKTVTNWLRTFGIKGYSIRKKEVYYFSTIVGEHDLKAILQPLKVQIDTYITNNRYPLKIGLHFVRKSKLHWDFHNISQILFDLLTALDIIPDDDVRYILPFPLSIEDKWYSYDKDNPGVYIKILE